MPGRTLSGAEGKGRYGFNGKERDKDMHSLTAYDYGFRIYNPAIGKFLSVDPLAKSYPWNSPYSYAEGDVIRSMDLDGLEKYVVTYWYDKRGNHRKTTIKAVRSRDSEEVMDLNFSTANGGDLTDKLVWVRKLYLDGSVKEQATGKEVLNASEQALFDKAVTKREKRPVEHPKIFYDFGDEKGFVEGKGYESEDFASDKYEFREAVKNIPLIQDLTPDIDLLGLVYLGNTDILPGADVSGNTNLRNGTIDWKLDGGEKLKTLLRDIKDDAGIKGVNISGAIMVGESNANEINEIKKGIGYFKQQLIDAFMKAGIKKENINIDFSTTATSYSLPPKIVLKR